MDGNISNEAAKDPIAETLQAYAQNILVVVFGFLPIFFVPSSIAPFEYIKVMFVMVGVLSALVLTSLAALRRGGVRVGLSYTVVGAWGVALTAGISALLSGDFQDALMGDVFTTHTTVFLILLALIMSTWTLADAGKRAVMRLYMLLAASTLILVLFHSARLFFGAEPLSLGVFTSAVSTPMGSWNDLALFLGLSVILALIALDQLRLTSVGRALFGMVTILSLLMLAVINFFIVWLILGLTSLAIVVYALTKDRFAGSQLPLMSERPFNTTSLIVSLVVFVVSVLFIIGGSSLGATISTYTGVSYVEVRPSLEATANIARNVYAENAFVGIGPNKFIDAWRLYKDPAINTTIFWNTDFVAGNGYLTTFFITTGVLGAFAWIAFMCAFVFSGIRMLILGNDQDRVWYFIGVSSFVSGLYIWGMSVVYVPGAVMLMLGALCMGITVTAERVLTGRGSAEFSLVTNRRTGFIFTLVVIAIIVTSVSGLYTVGKHYAGVREHNAGLRALEESGSEAARAYFERAYTLYPSDLYMRRIAEIQFARLNAILNLPSPTEAEQIEFRQVVRDGLIAAEEARTIDPLDPENWALVGNMYSVLMGSDIEGVYEKASEALLRSRELNPKNPLPALNLGILEGRKGNYEAARAYTEEAIALRPDFTEAFYYLSQIDIATGNVDGAIKATLSIITLEPQNPVRYYQLGVLEGARNNPEGAIAAFERAVSLDQGYANARYLLAIAYNQMKRTDEALSELEKVLELNPGNQDVVGLIEQLRTTGKLSVPQSEQAVVVGEESEVRGENGTVSTETEPGTSLVSPVNTVPDTLEESTITP
jgi:tetratricopeptide (TPR) repeat protein